MFIFGTSGVIAIQRIEQFSFNQIQKLKTKTQEEYVEKIKTDKEFAKKIWRAGAGVWSAVA